MSKQIKIDDYTYGILRSHSDALGKTLAKMVTIYAEAYKMPEISGIQSTYKKEDKLLNKRSTSQKRSIYLPELDFLFWRSLKNQMLQEQLLNPKGGKSRTQLTLVPYKFYYGLVEYGQTHKAFEYRVFTPTYVLNKHMELETSVSYAMDYRWAGCAAKYGKQMVCLSAEGYTDTRTGAQAMHRFDMHLPITKEIYNATMRHYDQCVRDRIPRICSRDTLDAVMRYKMANHGALANNITREREWVLPTWEAGSAENKGFSGASAMPTNIVWAMAATTTQTPEPKQETKPSEAQWDEEPAATQQEETQPLAEPAEPSEAQKTLSARIKAEEEEKEAAKAAKAAELEARRRKNEIEGLRVFVSSAAAEEKEAFYKRQEELAHGSAVEEKTASEIFDELWGGEE